MNRRDFIRHSLLVAGSLAATRALGTNPFSNEKQKNKENIMMDYVTLNNGVQMPILGYGTLRLPTDKCAECVSQAIRTGWRLIDTAKNYANEVEVGKGIRMSGINRKELFITSKLWFKDYGYEQAKKAFQATLNRLQLDYLDLYLLHQPFGDVYGAWQALEELYEAGISNFFPDRVTDFSFTNRVRPVMNQIEFSPYFQRWDDKKTNDEYGVQVESWGPLCSGMHPELLQEPVLMEIGRKYEKTPAQVILRWLTQQGVVTLCKTEHPERMVENLESLNFKLSVDDMSRIAKINKGVTQSKDHRAPADVRWFHTESTRELKQ